MKLQGKWNHEILHELGAKNISSNTRETIVSPDIDISKYSETILISALKKEKIKELKTFVTKIIYEKAPVYKQANVGIGIYDSISSTPIKNWIQAGRQACQEIEDKINAAINISEIEAITFTVDSLRTRIEEINLIL